MSNFTESGRYARAELKEGFVGFDGDGDIDLSYRGPLSVRESSCVMVCSLLQFVVCVAIEEKRYKHATLQCFKELYAQAKPTVGREQESESKEKHCCYKGGVKWKAGLGPQARSPKRYQCQHGGFANSIFLG